MQRFKVLVIVERRRGPACFSIIGDILSGPNALEFFVFLIACATWDMFYCLNRFLTFSFLKLRLRILNRGFGFKRRGFRAVSYTHLTLPTTSRV